MSQENDGTSEGERESFLDFCTSKLSAFLGHLGMCGIGYLRSFGEHTNKERDMNSSVEFPVALCGTGTQNGPKCLGS